MLLDPVECAKAGAQCRNVPREDMDKGEGKRYKFLRPRLDHFKGRREPWKLDLHTMNELCGISLVLEPGVAADLMMHYVAVLREHLCKPCPFRVV